jgi:hypothetical protein
VPAGPPTPRRGNQPQLCVYIAIAHHQIVRTGQYLVTGLLISIKSPVQKSCSAPYAELRLNTPNSKFYTSDMLA